MRSELVQLHHRGPDWNCRDCAEEWPCITFRRRIWSLYRRERHKLVPYMVHFLARARGEITAVPDAVLRDRFVGWIMTGPSRLPARPERREQAGSEGRFMSR